MSDDEMGTPAAWTYTTTNDEVEVHTDDGATVTVETAVLVGRKCRQHGFMEGSIAAFNALGAMSVFGVVRWWFAFRRRYGKGGAR